MSGARAVVELKFSSHRKAATLDFIEPAERVGFAQENAVWCSLRDFFVTHCHANRPGRQIPRAIVGHRMELREENIVHKSGNINRINRDTDPGSHRRKCQVRGLVEQVRIRA